MKTAAFELTDNQDFEVSIKCLKALVETLVVETKSLVFVINHFKYCVFVVKKFSLGILGYLDYQKLEARANSIILR